MRWKRVRARGRGVANKLKKRDREARHRGSERGRKGERKRKMQREMYQAFREGEAEIEREPVWFSERAR